MLDALSYCYLAKNSALPTVLAVQCQAAAAAAAVAPPLISLNNAPCK